jgi:5-amino-6-(5-phosphoribosylamino)uracil reductase
VKQAEAGVAANDDAPGAARSYVLLSVAVSVDGCIDDTSPQRLILSGQQDLDRVDEVRAGSDAIMVGAATVRRDNPTLLVRSPARRDRRAAQGLPASPARVTLTRSGDLDPAARFFTTGEGVRLVYAPAVAAATIRDRLANAPGTEIIGAGDPLRLHTVLADLAGRGVRRLMVEGGGSLLVQFLAAGLWDELHLAVAPVFVGDPAAPRLFGLPGTQQPEIARRLHLAEVRPVGDVVLLRYLPGSAPEKGCAPLFH